MYCDENLIQNGDFKDVQTQGSRQWWYAKDIPGWELENGAEIWRKGFKNITPPKGKSNYFVELDAKRKSQQRTNPDALQQTIETEASKTYQLSFYLRKRRTNKPENLKLSWGDEGKKPNTTHRIAATSTKSWELHQYQFEATSNETTIRF